MALGFASVRSCRFGRRAGADRRQILLRSSAPSGLKGLSMGLIEADVLRNHDICDLPCDQPSNYGKHENNTHSLM